MQLDLWAELVLQAFLGTHTVKNKDVCTTQTCSVVQRLEGSHTQVTVVVTDTAAAKRGVWAPIPCPVLSAYCNESVSLWLGRPHLRRTV